MPRPCTCDRLPPPEEPYSTAYCRLCWLYHNHDGYRAAWGGPGLDVTPPPGPAAVSPRSAPCFYLGGVLDRLGCACPGRWLYGCAVHGTTTVGRCKACADYEAG